MQTSLTIPPQSKSNLLLYSFAAIFSLFFSYLITHRQILINPDAICYLLSAESYGQNGLTSAMHLCGQAKWPFYSIIIYYFSHVTTLSYAQSAYCINALFSAISVLMFINIVKELTTQRQLLFFAAIVILLSQSFNDVREYIVRDHGFWAFYLSSMYFLLKYIKTFRYRDAFIWNICLLSAAAFRIEAIFFLGFIPFIVFFIPQLNAKARIVYFLKLYSLVFLFSGVITIWLLLHSEKISDWGRVADIVHQIKYGWIILSYRFSQIKTLLLQQILTQSSAHDVNLIIVLLTLIWYSLTIISAFTWIYFAFLIFAWLSPKIKFATSQHIVLIAYVLLNLIITFLFFSETLFLSKRYLIALTLTLMIWLPFAMHALWKKNNRAIQLLIIVSLSYSAISGLFDFGHSKSYVHDASSWLATRVAKDQMIYSNDIQVLYYSNHFGLDLFNKVKHNPKHLANIEWQRYQFLALRFSANEKESLPYLNQFNLIKTFANRRGDRVLIYQMKR